MSILCMLGFHGESVINIRTNRNKGYQFKEIRLDCARCGKIGKWSPVVGSYKKK